MNKKTKIITAFIAVGVLSALGSTHAHADTLENAQKQVESMDKQYLELTRTKDKLIKDNKSYQAQLLKTQNQLSAEKKQIANFVQNVQASSFSQGYTRMLLSSKSLKDLVEKVSIANNFARVNQNNLRELQKTMQKLSDTSQKNNATIANITREETSIKETLEAKRKLVSNIKEAERLKNNEVENVAVPTPSDLVEPEKSKSVVVPKVADVLSDPTVGSELPSTSGSSSSGGSSGSSGSNASGGTNANTPAPSPQPNINFVKMPSDGIGFDGGQCTYGADELLGGDVPNWWGNAVDWYANAQAQGLPIGSTPVAGALVIYGSNANIGGYVTGYQGHVGVVQSVEGSNIVVKEMNGTSGAWNYDIRTGSSTSGVVGYIYIK